MSDITKVQCRKCLLEDMDENDFLRDMRSHIAAYPEDKKVSEEEYRRRLDFCKDCDKLVDGMCVLCGCYVELRALKIGMRCADIDKKWYRHTVHSGKFLPPQNRYALCGFYFV